MKQRIFEILCRALYAHMNIFTPEKCRKYAQACRVLIPLVKGASAKADLERTAQGWERMAEQHADGSIGAHSRISVASIRQVSVDEGEGLSHKPNSEWQLACRCRGMLDKPRG